MTKIKKNMKQIVAIVLLMVLCVTSCPEFAAAAEKRNDIPVPILCYASSNDRVTTYGSVNGSYSGYIDGATDKVVILAVYKVNETGEMWCKVRYPVANGKNKDAYTQASNLFSTTNFSVGKIQIGSKKKVYRKSDMKKSFGTVYANDDVIVVGTSGNNTQIIYPISGGYKMGWISGIYQSNGEQDADLISGYYQIKTALNSESVLDIYGGSTSNGANLQLYSNHYALNQAFLIRKESDGYYSITPLHARDQRLDVENNGMTSGTNIIQWQANGGDNQKWKIVKTSDGYYSIISKLNGLYMDVYAASTADETNVWCYERNGTLAQKFILQEAKLNGKRYCETEEGKKEAAQTTTKEETNNTTTAPTVNISIEELCFNYIYYADKYTDLKAAYGYDKALLLNHWKRYGIKEGRSASPILDLTYYLQKNQDLQKAFGTNYTKVYNHFITYGYKEFRNSSPYYNGQFYRDNYSDLRSYDSFSLLNHYCQFGISEKRQAGEKLFTGNYDYSASQGNSSSQGNTSWDDQIGKTLADISSKYYTSGNISAVSGYKGQCTWYAYGRFYEVNQIALKSAPHAKYWLSYNSGDSRVSVLYGAENIRSQCIAVRTSGTHGHVMYIEYVSYNNAGQPEYVYYTECNTDGNGRYDAGKDCVLKKKSYSKFVSENKPAGYIVAN